MLKYVQDDNSKINEPFAVAGAAELLRYTYIAEIKDMDKWYEAVRDFILMYQGR